MERNRKGDIAEYKAAIWLMEQGYEVFRNMGYTGPVDLIAKIDNEYLNIDVKTLQRKNNDYIFRHSKLDEQIVQGIRTLWVFEDQIGWNRDYFI